MIACRVLPRLGDMVAVSSRGRRLIVASVQGLQVLDVQRGRQIARSERRADDHLAISGNGLYATRAALDPKRWAHAHDQLDLWDIERDTWEALAGHLHGGNVSFRKDDAFLSVSADPGVMLSLPNRSKARVGTALGGPCFWTSEGTLFSCRKKYVFATQDAKSSSAQSAEERALLKAIGRAPSDEVPRVVLADWLEAQGRGREAEIVRAGARLLVLRDHHDGWMKTRERALLDDAAEHQNLVRSRKAEGELSSECRRAVGDQTIRGCSLNTCSKRWDRLEGTQSSWIRQCAQCHEQVHYAEWHEEAAELARAKMKHVYGGAGTRVGLVGRGQFEASSLTEQSGLRFDYPQSSGRMLEDIWEAKLRAGWPLPELERQHTAIAVDGTAVATVLPSEIRVYYEPSSTEQVL